MPAPGVGPCDAEDVLNLDAVLFLRLPQDLYIPSLRAEALPLQGAHAVKVAMFKLD